MTFSVLLNRINLNVQYYLHQIIQEFLIQDKSQSSSLLSFLTLEEGCKTQKQPCYTSGIKVWWAERCFRPHWVWPCQTGTESSCTYSESPVSQESGFSAKTHANQNPVTGCSLSQFQFLMQINNFTYAFHLPLFVLERRIECFIDQF